jgi:DNA-binding response OmpR family regulator
VVKAPIVAYLRIPVVKVMRNRNDEVAMRRADGAVTGEQAFGAKAAAPLGSLRARSPGTRTRTARRPPVELRPKALDVLMLLAEHAGQVVDKSTLMDRVWPGVVVGDDSLTQTVVEIRRALGDR